MEHIKSNLKEYREGAGLSQDRLADDIGVNRKTIIAMESEDGSDPKVSTIKRSLKQIAEILSYEKVMIPSAYAATHRPSDCHCNSYHDPYRWNGTTISYIINRREYLGHTILGKTVRVEKRGKKKRVPVAEKDLIVFENTHEPIITQDMWDKAHKKKRISNKKNPSNTHSHRLSGYIYCADCGSRMSLSTQTDKNGKYIYAFQCSQYRNSAMYGECESHYISADALEELILESIKKLAEHVLDDEDAFIEEVTNQCNAMQIVNEDESKRELESANRRITELNFILKKLYEDNLSGKINDRQFTFLSSQYDGEVASLEQKIEEIRAIVIEEKSDKANPKKFVALVKKYTDITAITDEMLFEFIDRVDVHTVTGGRTRYRQQKVDIHFNFLGEYVPAGDEISEEERRAIIDAEHEEKLKAKGKRSYEKQKELMKQLKIDAENGDQEAIEKLAHKKEIARKASAKANAKLREARNADPEYIAKQEAKEQARILKVQEQERKRAERAQKKRKEKRSELVARAKTDPKAMEELMAIRAKEKVARDKKKAIQEARMAEDPEYAKEVFIIIIIIPSYPIHRSFNARVRTYRAGRQKGKLMKKTLDERFKEAQKEADMINRKRQKYGAYRQRVRGGNGTCYYPVKPHWKTVDYIDLCRYDKEFKYAVEVRVKKDGFALGRKGDYLRLTVSEYGMDRLQSDELDGLIDITSNSVAITGFNFPDVSNVGERIKEMEALFREAVSNGEPLPECIRKMIDE